MVMTAAHWRLVADGGDGQRLVDDGRQLSLIWSIATELDGQRWLHVSIASPRRMPTWDELVEVKEALIGTDREAYQVLPPRSRWVNIHPNCLHLFALAEGDGDRAVLPDFTHGGATL